MIPILENAQSLQYYKHPQRGVDGAIASEQAHLGNVDRIGWD
jgi:hypothetical protein